MPPALGDPEETAEASSLNLTADQLAAAGLDSLQPGDSFTVTITGTVDDSANGLKATVTDASNGQPATEEPGGDATGMSHADRFPSAERAGMKVAPRDY